MSLVDKHQHDRREERQDAEPDQQQGGAELAPDDLGVGQARQIEVLPGLLLVLFGEGARRERRDEDRHQEGGDGRQRIAGSRQELREPHEEAGRQRPEGDALHGPAAKDALAQFVDENGVRDHHSLPASGGAGYVDEADGTPDCRVSGACIPARFPAALTVPAGRRRGLRFAPSLAMQERPAEGRPGGRVTLSSGGRRTGAYWRR